MRRFSRQSLATFVSMVPRATLSVVLAVGEAHEEMGSQSTAQLHCHRYLMGVGAPDSLIDGVIRGVDMF